MAMDAGGVRPTLRLMAKGFLPYTMDQRLLLPPDLREWPPEGHLALFIGDVVDTLDVSPMLRACAKDDDRGRAGYHSSRRIARSTEPRRWIQARRPRRTRRPRAACATS
jgi:hypothetical protein